MKPSRDFKPLSGRGQTPPQADISHALERLGIRGDDLCTYANLPFSAHDISAGSETELQAVVVGPRDRVDLPLTIEQSRYFTNLKQRTRAGESPERLLSELESFLADNRNEVWENSWVRFERARLSPFAEQTFTRDLMADKGRPQSGLRSDAQLFQYKQADGKDGLRVPVSYLVKLALADFLGNRPSMPETLKAVGRDLMEHYLNDNTSPETFSFHVVAMHPGNGMGQALARETSKRLLFTQLLIQYANERLGLIEQGQKAMIYLAPHPPERQKELNDIIPDAFYRSLFMSPCLSGWDKGEGKHGYMKLCHEVLSRSQLNAVAKLREAGIIVRNLVVLPTVSNTSLANNGTHISLGSRRLSSLMSDPHSGFGQSEEKSLGDLSIKIMEHFLPLFAATFSAAPYRLGFDDFHPEKALGFLPHELDFNHLRMLWRRWKKKASLSAFGHNLTPFGPEWLDRGVSGLFGMRGDLVPDARLVDYPVCLLSTEQSPACNGRIGNQDQLKNDLADMGVFDRQMSLYQFFKIREHAAMGFSGFEGRHYSLFPSLRIDMAAAASLQAAITALAYRYMASGTVKHRHIPDTSFIESERRQIFFGMAVGIPTFYVRRHTRNRFLLRILRQADGIRTSRRYPGYLRVQHAEYCKALLKILHTDGADIIEAFNLTSMLSDLKLRLTHPAECSAAGTLTRGILDEIGASNPLKVAPKEFNEGAEAYYRGTLRRRHMEEGLAFLEEDLLRLESDAQSAESNLKSLLNSVMGYASAPSFFKKAQNDVLDENSSPECLERLIELMILVEHQDRIDSNNKLKNHDSCPEANVSNQS